MTKDMKSEAERAIVADVCEQIGTTTMRIFVGGLGETVTDNDLRRMFVSLGSVDEIEIIRSKGRNIAYLNFTPSSVKSLAKLFSSFNGCVWKGGKLRIEKAKEHYLVKVEREREKELEEEIERNETAAKRATEGDAVVTVKKPCKGHEADMEQIRIFFPKLRKVKPLPFSGCGKHKYSFRNIPVPRLPTHFCDCDEHAVPYDAPIANGEVDEKEFDLMHSVLNKFIAEDGNSSVKAESAGPNKKKSPAVSDDALASEENAQNSEPDEDGIIINISGVMKETTFSWNSEARKVFEYQGSNDHHPHPPEVNDKRLQNINKKRKLSEGSIESVKQSLKKKKDDLKAASTLPLGISSTQAKKSKWKELVGISSDSSFKLSNVLPLGGVNESVQQEDTEDESRKSEELDDDSAEDTEDESSTSMGTDEEAEESTDDDSGQYKSDNVVDEEAADELEEFDDEVEEGSRGEISKQGDSEDGSDKFKESGDEMEEKYFIDELAKHDDTEDESGKLEESDGEMEEEESSDALAKQETAKDQLDESQDTAEEVSDEVAQQDDSEDELNSMEQSETLPENDKNYEGIKVNDKEDGESVKKGPTWSQIMPWTQLVSDLDNNSFSISQILPGGSASQVAEKPSLKIMDNSTNQSSKAVKDASAPVSDDYLTNSATDLHEDKNLINAAQHSEASNTTGANNFKDSALKPVVEPDTYVPRPFVRCEASLKEWVKLKESIRKSQAKKRKTPKE